MGKNMSNMAVLMFSVIGVLSFSVASSSGELQLGFYDNSCPKAEKLIKEFVQDHIPNAPSLAATLLRMQFHDCFVRGCDASVLLNVTSTNPSNATEKTATPNMSLRGFDFIDRVKAIVEKECPGVVSCADIISLVARDSVVVTGGPYWKVPTGRRDGMISNATESLNNIPAPTFNFSSLAKSFAKVGLNVKDLVLLSGSHTIGIGHCSAFSSRLYNYTGVGDEDPSLDNEYAANLRNSKCTNPKDNVTFVEMDPGSARTFDLDYYKLVLKRRGLFHSDAALTTDSNAKSIIMDLVDSSPSKFFKEFGVSMEKMSRIQVKTGTEGEIRRHCAFPNNH